VLKHLYKRLTPLSHLFQLKTWVALVKGLNLTFHNIELNTIMQNMFMHTKMNKIFAAYPPRRDQDQHINASLGKVCCVISN